MVIPSDKLPEEFRHIRQSTKRVKPEFYTTVDKLISTKPLLQTPSGFSCDNCRQRNVWQTMETPQ